MPPPVTESWTASDLDELRRAWADGLPVPLLARAFGRTEAEVLDQVRRLGLRRFWQESELATVRRMWGRHEAAAIAAALPGRSVTSVYRVATKLGLPRLWRRHPPEFIAAIRRLHRQGLDDVAIAGRLGSDRETVHAVRYARLGLPPNEAAILAKRRKGVKTQFARLGIRSGGELRQLGYRRFAARNGWPEDLRPREVQILNALAARGVPMTRPELARAIGMRTDREDRPGHVALLAGNGPGGTYTASLLRRGLLVALKRASVVHGRGKRRSRDLYALGPAALAILEERARCPSNAKL
jgi:hypothetical protein